jgi:two-component system sensor histidine kinase KdpD
VRFIPLKVSHRVVGMLRLRLQDDPSWFADAEYLEEETERPNTRTAFFWTFLDQATSAIEQARLRQENMQVEVLQRTDALRASLLSSVSHDLRTPLSSIKASASSLLQEDVQWSEEERRGFALTIEQEADRLNRLVSNLLDMSRIEGGAIKPEKEWYPLQELIQDVLERLQPLLQGRRVQTDIPDDLPPIELDYLQMDQVFTNLIENAVRYTPPTSPIEIRARREDSNVIISVADRGPGIPIADLEHVFDKFYRVTGRRSSGSVPGTGLGLAVSRGLVEAHGGKIWAEQRPDGGTIFYIRLPIGARE